MDWCKQVGDWIRDNIEKPIKQFLQDMYQACAEARKWVEREIRTPIETWQQQLQQRCREQECNWWRLCCNKWLCWLVAILVSILVWIIQIIGEWLIELICKIIVTIITVIVTIIVQFLKWMALGVVCLLVALCSFLFLLAGIALIAALLSLVALNAERLVFSRPTPASQSETLSRLIAAVAKC